MAFKFRFQSVLKYRRHQADAAEMELAKVQRQLAAVAEQLERLRASREAGYNGLAHCLQKGAVGRELFVWRVYLTDLEARIELELQRMENMRIVVEDLRSRLLEAARKKKVMEQIRDRDLEAWRQAQNRGEERELNELAVQLYRRKSS